MLFTTFTSAPCRRKVSYQNYLEIAPETRIAEWANIEIAILWQSPLPNPQLVLADVLRSHPDVPQPEQEIYQALYDSLAARHA